MRAGEVEKGRTEWRPDLAAIARQVADEVLFIDGGLVVEHGPPERVILDPQQPRTQAFLQRILDPL